MKKRSKIGECIYCGKKSVLEADHVPPKNLFPKPRPSNLVTVPSCSTCNRRASLDDEYFRLMISMRDDVYIQPGVKNLWEKSYRGLSRNDQRGLSNLLLGNIKQGPAYTQEGIYLGNRTAYNIDLNRLERVVERTLKGLFYYHRKSALPQDYMVRSWAVDGIDRRVMENDKDFKQIINALLGLPEHSIGKYVFAYRFSQIKEDLNTTYWLFTFYKRISFLGITLNINQT